MPDVSVVVTYEDGRKVEYPFIWEDSDLAEGFACEMSKMFGVVDVRIVEWGVCVG